ncbi:transporter substrate-binding domain-containing protein [Micromonospora cathayae]|uniref:Transporter substrate-binding domain-containing protein n=1 Tax=Micromonospora cathayae TaxID=3028804 RepID=A0ABY7ZIT9_9ACTN|nr:transporter substrate-binding domain-containing protein [Micromonospora sp. HUAS 3]WDZ82894.1 transporter substrate-binding domain-containing protein [Micromonospora sp. HUAS 3]
MPGRWRRRVRVGGDGRPTGTGGLALFVCLAMVAVSTLRFVSLPPLTASVSDVLSRSSISGRTELRVGVLADAPLLSAGPAVAPVGFDADLARYLAGSLGKVATFVPLAAEDRIASLESGQVDVVFAALAMTSERKRIVAFSGPYLEGGTALLAPPSFREGEASNVLCTVAGTVTERELLRRGVRFDVRPDLRDCVEQVRAGRLAAVLGDEIGLLGFTQEPGNQLVIRPAPPGLPRYWYGIGVPLYDPHLKRLVDSFLLVSYDRPADGAWRQAMDRSLGKAGFTGEQPKPEGTRLRNATDGLIRALGVPGGEPAAGGPVTVPSAVSPGSPPTTGRRRRRTLAHRRSRRTPTPRRRSAVRVAPDRHGSVRGVDPPRATVLPDPAPAPLPGGAVNPGPWSLLLGVPVAVSALYLWIQSGGDRQLTLMLAQSVNPITFLATVSLSVVWIFPAVPALVFTVGAVVLGGAVGPVDRRRLCARYIAARWTARTPAWAIWASVVVAAVSTPIVFLPAWGLSLFAIHPTGRSTRRVHRVLARLALAGTAVVIARAAVDGGEPALAVVAGWPALMVFTGVDTPLRRTMLPAFVRTTAVLAAALGLGVLYNVVTTPILPSTAFEVAPAAAPTGAPATGGPTATDPDAAASTSGTVRLLRGYVVATDDDTTTLLSDTGGVEIVPNDDIRSRVSCPSFTDLPEDSAKLRDLPLRESMLRALARDQRAATFQHPHCLDRAK